MHSLILKKKKVEDLMTTNVLTIPLDSTFAEVMRLFGEFPFHHLPVVLPNNRIVGVISTNDILNTITKHMSLLKDLSDDTLNEKFEIVEVMTSFPHTVTKDTPVEEVLRKCAKYEIHSLPVVKDGVLEGIITTNDILEEWKVEEADDSC